jgi:HlyD family secretion protein
VTSEAALPPRRAAAGGGGRCTKAPGGAAEGALTTARASLENPNIRAAQEGVVRRQIAQQQSEIAAAAASANQSRFALNEAQADRKDLLVIAPFDGTVITRSAEPGEVVTAGTPIVTLLDLTKVYLRGFVRRGDQEECRWTPARVYLD